MNKVCILDYGSGNVRSVFNLFNSVVNCCVSNALPDIEDATHIVLPGVGAFGAAMQKIRTVLPIDQIERVVVQNGKPFLGICVGMQVLAERGSEFGDHAGLGWIHGTVDRLQSGILPLPHIGWNNIAREIAHPLFDELGEDPDFYFLHSYALRNNTGKILATAEFGEVFCAAIAQDNILGVQFHPEKSLRAGLKLITNFLALS